MNDIDYMQIAFDVARKESTDPSTQNGAILLISTGEIVAAANHFPKGVQETPDRWERPKKYSFVEHAERNVIFKAARLGLKTDGAIMYCPWFACADCARAIVQAGIKEVIGHKWNIDEATNKRWAETCEFGFQILTEGGVPYRYIENQLGVEPVRRDGKLFYP